VRVVAQDVAVLEGSRLALIRIAHHVLVAGKRARHETPLETGRETGTTAAAQNRFLDFVDDITLRHFLFENARSAV
jgi:hypothetical protein